MAGLLLLCLVFFAVSRAFVGSVFVKLRSRKITFALYATYSAFFARYLPGKNA